MGECEVFISEMKVKMVEMDFDEDLGQDGADLERKGQVEKIMMSN